jgi:hypothetical protein
MRNHGSNVERVGRFLTNFTNISDIRISNAVMEKSIELEATDLLLLRGCPR